MDDGILYETVAECEALISKACMNKLSCSASLCLASGFDIYQMATVVGFNRDDETKVMKHNDKRKTAR